MTKIRLFILCVAVVAVGCASASGYDAKRYTAVDRDKADADVDTEPVASAPRSKIPDPRGPVTPTTAPDASSPPRSP